MRNARASSGRCFDLSSNPGAAMCLVDGAADTFWDSYVGDSGGVALTLPRCFCLHRMLGPMRREAMGACWAEHEELTYREMRALLPDDAHPAKPEPPGAARL